MNSTDLFFAIGEMDATILKKSEQERKRVKLRRLCKWASVPAAVCLCIAILLTVFPPLPASAEFSVEDGVLLSYNGKKEKVIIPETVTSVADYAFSNSPQLTAVTVTENVRSIGSCAFYGCLQLADITISENNSSFIKENNTVMSSDRRLIVRYFGNVETYVIPESVLFLAAEAFAGSGVQQVVLNRSIRFIGKDCFRGMTNPPQKEITQYNTFLKDHLQNPLILLKETDSGELYGSVSDGLSEYNGVISAYSWDANTGTAFLYRFGSRGEYYQVLSFQPKITGVADGSGLSGNFWSDLDGVYAIDSGVTIKYDANGNEYIVENDPYYDGFSLVTDLYITHDGGLSWAKLEGQPPLRNQKYITVSTGFADNNVGYICSRRYSNVNPTAYVTTDGGRTWQDMTVVIPLDRFDETTCSGEILSITKMNSVYVITVNVHDASGSYDLTYTSANGIEWNLMK